MNNEAIKKIADTYGFSEQSRQLAEECSELIVAVNKYRRQSKKSLNTPSDYLSLQCRKADIVEEIADTIIMIEQIKYLLNISNEDIEQVVDQKLNKQLERIGADERKS